jgi:hypothetical protein
MEMTMDEAIKLIQEDIDDESVDWDTPLGEAYKMSFEALKLLKAADFSGGAHTFKGKSVEQCVLIPKDKVAAGPFADLLKE